jgi:hypothetical protein
LCSPGVISHSSEVWPGVNRVIDFAGTLAQFGAAAAAEKLARNSKGNARI